MKLKIFCRCSLFPSWSGQGLISSPVSTLCLTSFELPEFNLITSVETNKNDKLSICYVAIADHRKFTKYDV